MKFSLILCTLNRSEELVFCLESLANQIYKNFEIIVIDQSDDDKTETVINLFGDLNIKYKHVVFKGLSKSRNYALRFVDGEYFCLIDDDAIYDQNYLDSIYNSLKSRKDVIVSGYIFDLICNDSYCNYNDINDNQDLSVREIFRYCPSAGLTIPSCAMGNIPFFDEKFGVGSIYSSGEETDLLLRLNRRGIVIIFDNNAKLKHPCGNIEKFKFTEIKTLQYVKGQGALFSKKINLEKDYRVIPYFTEKLCKLFVKKLFNIFRLKHNRELNSFLEGYYDYKKSVE